MATTRYIAVLLYGDRSGIIQAFGPYADEEAANEAADTLRQWNAIHMAGSLWEVLPCVDTTVPLTPAK